MIIKSDYRFHEFRKLRSNNALKEKDIFIYHHNIKDR